MKIHAPLFSIKRGAIANKRERYFSQGVREGDPRGRSRLFLVVGN